MGSWGCASASPRSEELPHRTCGRWRHRHRGVRSAGRPATRPCGAASGSTGCLPPAPAPQADAGVSRPVRLGGPNAARLRVLRAGLAQRHGDVRALLRTRRSRPAAARLNSRYSDPVHRVCAAARGTSHEHRSQSHVRAGQSARTCQARRLGAPAGRAACRATACDGRRRAGALGCVPGAGGRDKIDQRHGERRRCGPQGGLCM